jgi:hypothetical protein
MLRDQQHPHPGAAQASRIANNAAGPAAPAPKRCASVSRSKQCCGTSSTRTQALRKRRAHSKQGCGTSSNTRTKTTLQRRTRPLALRMRRVQQTMLREQRHAPKRFSSVARSKQCWTSTTRTQASRAANNTAGQQQFAHQSDSPAPHPPTSAAQASRAANNAAGPAAPAPRRCARVAHSKQCCGTSSTRTQALRKRRAQQTMLRDQQYAHQSASPTPCAANNAAGAPAPALKRCASIVRRQQ